MLTTETAGAPTEAETCRRILCALGTNGLWSKFNTQGRNGKRKIIGNLVYEVIKRVFRANHPSPKLKFESQLSEQLKQAPARRGGDRYIQKHGRDNGNADNEADREELQESFESVEL